MRGALRVIGTATLGIALMPSVTVAEEPKKPVVLWDLPYQDTGKKPGVEGSILAIGDPVHETLTLVAARDAGLVSANTARSDSAMTQYIRGVFWNDDPCGQLFMTASSLTPSAGLEWWWDFHRADKERAPKRFAALTCKQLGRSHFGDLQFLHGMASGDGIPASETLKLVMAWARFAYAVATEKVGPTAQLKNVEEAKSLPPLNGATPQALFKSGNAVALRQRAIASIAHMIQDSYAMGHTQRVVGNDKAFGAIVKFRSYANQDHGKHKTDDMWQGGSTDIEKIRKFRGGSEALAATTALFKLYGEKAEWSKVESYLRNGPFRLAGTTSPSGP